MSSYGEKTLFTVTGGRSVQLTADGAPEFKVGGVTIDWDEVPAVPANGQTYYGVTVADDKVVLESGVEVPVGEKALRYGTVLMRDSGTGYYRPALAADGGSLVRGETFLVNETMLESDTGSDHPGALDGGTVFEARMAYSENVATIVAGSAPPSKAEVEAVMPRVVYATD